MKMLSLSLFSVKCRKFLPLTFPFFVIAASLSVPSLGIPGTMGAIVAAAALANQQQQQQQQQQQSSVAASQAQLGLAAQVFNTQASLNQQTLANSALTNSTTSNSLANLSNLSNLAALQNQSAAGIP